MRRQVHDGIDLGVLRRSAGASANGDVLGECESDWAAVGVRRGETILGSSDHGLPSLSPGGHAYSPHLQHLRAADADQRWPGDSEFHVAGVARRKSYRLWRWQPDAQFLLRERRSGWN